MEVEKTRRVVREAPIEAWTPPAWLRVQVLLSEVTSSPQDWRPLKRVRLQLREWPKCFCGRAVLAEQHDEWAEGRRHLGLEALAKARLAVVVDEEQVSQAPLALTA